MSKASAIRAAGWCDYLESHARRCYGLLRDAGLRAAKTLARKLERGDLKTGFTAHDVRRHQWSNLQTPDDVESALDWLEEFRLDPPNAAAGRPEPGRQANGPLRDPSRPSVGGRQMIDWLEVARRELSPGPGEVSVVFTGGEPRDPETNGPPPTSDGGSFAAGGRDLDGEPPTDRGTVEERVSAVFTVGGSEYPPAKPGALGCEPLKAVRRVADAARELGAA